MNVRPQLKDGKDNPLADEKVRQAMNYAIDKDALIQIVTFDVGQADDLLHVVGHAAASPATAGSIPMIWRRPRRC